MRTLSEINRLIDQMEYDFTHFTLKHYVEHIQGLVRRPVQTILYPLHGDFFGAWIPTSTTHFILCNRSLHPVHKVHTILHELGHIVLRHTPQPVREVLPDVFLEVLQSIEPVEYPVGQTRTLVSTMLDQPQERECETMVFLIRQRLLNAARFEELLTGSSIREVERYVDAMGFLK